MVDQFGGVPKDQSKIIDFFTRAKAYGPTTSTDEAGETTTSSVMELEGGLKVEFLNVGMGPTVPKGSKVAVHYTGKLTNGTVFDSSHSRGEPIEFMVGAGQVIKAWDLGICQLQKGQKAVLTCPPAMAYGSSGVPGVIPPNSTLIFEVELVSF